jgi:hypothetical protein
MPRGSPPVERCLACEAVGELPVALFTALSAFAALPALLIMQGSEDGFTDAEKTELGFETLAFGRTTHETNLSVSGLWEVGEPEHLEYTSIGGILNPNRGAKLSQPKPYRSG